MKRLYFIEPIVAIYAFASFMVYPLVQQYVYRRLWLEITNSSYPVSDNTSHCTANSTSHTELSSIYLSESRKIDVIDCCLWQHYLKDHSSGKPCFLCWCSVSMHA
uniref:Uncharacterized protein n=1 Tax=Sinocyclocheilus anshuiensis TaxID=1608454 RepID=A0A671RI10_9TELE